MDCSKKTIFTEKIFRLHLSKNGGRTAPPHFLGLDKFIRPVLNYFAEFSAGWQQRFFAFFRFLVQCAIDIRADQAINFMSENEFAE
jgi:hypothetical protein